MFLVFFAWFGALMSAAEQGDVVSSPEQLRLTDITFSQLLQRSCAECHADGKRKGGLGHITDLDRMLAEDMLVPGEPMDSDLYRVLITDDEDERMPPAKALHSPALSADEIAAVRQWIMDRVDGPVVALAAVIEPTSPSVTQTGSEGTADSAAAPIEPPAGDTEATSQGPQLTAGEVALVLLGRWHPVFLHFPIALLMVLCLEQFWTALRKKPLAQGSSGLLVCIGALGSVFAAVTGWFAAEYGFSGLDLAIHRWAGIVLTVMALLTWFLWWRTRMNPAVARWYVLALVIVFALLVVTGHYGNILTRGDPDSLWAP